MTIDDIRFPVLNYLEYNKLIKVPDDILDNSGYDHKIKLFIRRSFDFFLNQEIKINHISQKIHEELQRTPNFIAEKKTLKEIGESTGLLLLPETIYPDFTHVPCFARLNSQNYPINAIFYSWLTFDNHDRISGTYTEEDARNNDQHKDLLIIPLYKNRITQATDTYFMINNDDLYGDKYNTNHRQWYGKIHDYVMSFLLLDNTIKNEKQVEETAKLKLNYQKVIYDKNNIEFIQ